MFFDDFRFSVYDLVRERRFERDGTRDRSEGSSWTRNGLPQWTSMFVLRILHNSYILGHQFLETLYHNIVISNIAQCGGRWFHTMRVQISLLTSHTRSKFTNCLRITKSPSYVHETPDTHILHNKYTYTCMEVSKMSWSNQSFMYLTLANTVTFS